MDFVEVLRGKAREAGGRIVLPECGEPRVLEACSLIARDSLADIILLGDLKKARAKGMPLPDKISVIDPCNYQGLERYIESFYDLRKHKGMTKDEARRLLLSNYVYIAAMMVREGAADGFVAGASFTTRDVARAAIQCIGVNRDIGVVSGAFIMVMPDKGYAEDGIFVFADCAIVPEPNPRQLASIAVSSADLLHCLFSLEPRIAMLSYSTKGSGVGEGVDRVREAAGIVKAQRPDILIDGEFQVDAAISPEVCRIKAPDSPLKGRANVLIFPNLDSGNIACKLTQRLAGARAVGPVLQGLNMPASDLSRGCAACDIVDAVAMISVMAQCKIRNR